jgi:hypothetical protein
VNETIDQFAAGSFGIKRAIDAFLRAERNVDVKAGDVGCDWIRHEARVNNPFTAGERKCSRRENPWMLTAQALWSLYALNMFGFQPFFTRNDFEGNNVALIQGFESLTGDGGMMHKYILPGTLGNEAKPFFIIEPLDFAAGHNDS